MAGDTIITRPPVATLATREPSAGMKEPSARMKEPSARLYEPSTGLKEASPELPLMRLMQIISQSLPTGAFSYSQGLEWAVNAGWVHNRHTFETWVSEQLKGTQAKQELPLLRRFYEAHRSGDQDLIRFLTATVLSLRETSELRAEERNRGYAMARLTEQLCVAADKTAPSESGSSVSARASPGKADKCQLGVFAEYCAAEKIPIDKTMQGYAFSWLESQVMAGIKLVPLGQTDGQQILYQLSGDIGSCVQTALTVTDNDIGYSSPALSLASSLHETQYSRLFRS